MKSFEIVAKSNECGARAGRIITPRGCLDTPAFLPVGTNASVKSLSSQDMESLKIGMILANTYHLYLRPGLDVIESAGGLHRFMCWDKPVLTDSGGFQVFSLSDFVKIKDDGVRFRSHIDGSEHFFTPQKALDVQLKLGSDIIMVLDECAGYPVQKAVVKKALERTLSWAKTTKACYDEYESPKGQLFGIIQGGVFTDLRRESAKRTSDIDFHGYAVGGLSVGEPKELLYESADAAVGFMPEEKVRYAMGVGLVEDLWNLVEMGFDIFDCVVPTRNARKGQIFTFSGKYNITNSRFRNDNGPLETGCRCFSCRNYSRAYVQHLFKAGELLAPRLATLHNLYFMLKLMNLIGKSIKSGCFYKQKQIFLAGWNGINE